MTRFGKYLLLRVPFSSFQKLTFYLFGQDFIGAAMRIAHFKKALKKIPSLTSLSKTILDAGCGTGDFSFYVAERYPLSYIDAYDIVDSTLETNKAIAKKAGLTNITFTKQDLLHLDQNDKQYQLIFSIGTLIYFSKEKTKKIIENFAAATEIGGYLYLDLPQEDFLEVNWIPTKFYPTFYAALKEENSGDLYSFDEMVALLQNFGFEIVSKNKSFGYFGKFAWEFDNVLRERKLIRLRPLFLPFLKILTTLDARMKNTKGCCFVILARKHSRT
jgi:ubiquinone/menaquinone biosynthesis C-methylase UbiE